MYMIAELNTGGPSVRGRLFIRWNVHHVSHPGTTPHCPWLMLYWTLEAAKAEKGDSAADAYPHGFLDVVLPDHLSRTVHVPLEASDQLPAGHT